MIKKLRVVFLMFFLINMSIAFPIYAAGKNEMVLNYDGESHIYRGKSVNLVVNGIPVTDLSMPPIIFNDYTLVPAREVFEPLGAVVEWEPDLQQVHIMMDNTNIVMQINNEYAVINNTPVIMDIPPKIINDKTMIPLRFVADNLNYMVNWVDGTSTVYIDDIGILIGKPDEDNKEDKEDLDDTPNPDYGYPDDSSTDPAKDLSQSEILYENHKETTIKSVQASENGDSIFTIVASSEITWVEKTLYEDNRLIIDIHNATLTIPQGEYKLNDNPYAFGYRAAQFQVTPEKIVRVVFDLKDGAEYYVGLSSDRTNLTVSFTKNTIQNVVLTSSADSDTLIITGSSSPTVNVTNQPNSDMLLIDITNAVLSTGSYAGLKGIFVSDVSIMERGDCVQLVLNLSDTVDYSVKYQENSAFISIYKSKGGSDISTGGSNISAGFKSIEYDYINSRLILKKDSRYLFEINGIVHKDDYLNLKYVLTLPGDFSEYFESGTINIGDSYINTVSVSTSMGATSITINENYVLAYDVYEDMENIIIKPVLPKNKYSRIVVIDAGHGGSAPGTSGYGLVEKNLTLDISERLRKKLESDGLVKVYTTRNSDVNPSFDDRTGLANQVGDLFVSIHLNFAETYPGSGIANPVPNGTETFYYPHINDSTIGISSEDTAKIMQDILVRNLNTMDRTAKMSSLKVLRDTTVPAILCEIGFLSNQNDATRLSTESFRQEVAEALAQGIYQIFNVYSPRR